MASPAAYVTDAHSLLWYLYDAPRLSRAAQHAFDRVDTGQATLIVPSIALAELIFIAEHRRVVFDIDALLECVAMADNLLIAPFDLAALACLKKTTAIPEMHDRMIVCAALAHNAPLITRDIEIRKASIVETVW